MPREKIMPINGAATASSTPKTSKPYIFYDCKNATCDGVGVLSVRPLNLGPADVDAEPYSSRTVPVGMEHGDAVVSHSMPENHVPFSTFVSCS